MSGWRNFGSTTQEVQLSAGWLIWERPSTQNSSPRRVAKNKTCEVIQGDGTYLDLDLGEPSLDAGSPTAGFSWRFSFLEDVGHLRRACFVFFGFFFLGGGVLP